MFNGTKVLDDEKETQDFILVNHPIFFLVDAQGYIDLQTIKAQGASPDPELLKKLEKTFAILGVIKSKQISNPLFIQYWSTTPYKLGSYAIKFLVKPHNFEQSPTQLPDSPNYLREAIVQSFSDSEETIKFDFQIQLFVDDEKTPIENSMIEWQESDSPSITVATIEIPKQAFDFAERKQFDANLSFSPWHTLPEHEPLGDINLSRKKIYQEGAQHRRDYFHERLREPQPYSSILDDPHQ